MTTTPKTLTLLEQHQLLDALLYKNGTKKQFRRGIRNYTMALLMLDAGLRVGEVVALLISDLYFGGVPVSGLIIRPEIAKTKTERTVPLSERIRNALVSHAEQIKDEQPDYVPCFFHAHKGGFRIMTTRQVERIIRTAALKSISRPVHPHMLRHTFATKVWRKAGERITQELLGHQNISSTHIYTHPNQQDLVKAIEKIEDEPSEFTLHF